MQAKADAVDANCPSCEQPLIEKKYRVPKTIDCYCGDLRLYRTHGWCKPCRPWVFPADAALGLGPDSTASPLVQELSALLVTKMPAEHRGLSLWVDEDRLRGLLLAQLDRPIALALGLPCQGASA